jgi:hypothetical protein
MGINQTSYHCRYWIRMTVSLPIKLVMIIYGEKSSSQFQIKNVLLIAVYNLHLIRMCDTNKGINMYIEQET